MLGLADTACLYLLDLGVEKVQKDIPNRSFVALLPSTLSITFTNISSFWIQWIVEWRYVKVKPQNVETHKVDTCEIETHIRKAAGFGGHLWHWQIYWLRMPSACRLSLWYPLLLIIMLAQESSA